MIAMTDYHAAAISYLGAPGLARFSNVRDHLGRSRLGLALLALGCWVDPVTGTGGIGQHVFYRREPAVPARARRTRKASPK